MAEATAQGGRLDVRIDEKIYPGANGAKVAAVRGLAFTVAPGEFVCMIGPSGCGKTTTLRILLGLDRSFAGSVSLSGADPSRPARLGTVFQEPRLLPWRTVDENVRIALPPSLKGRPLSELFAELGLAECADLYPGELSLGLERRVALARALAVEPDILVLDEPFVSLDDLTAQRLRALVAAAVNRRSATALMVTHHLGEALELADRLILLAPRPTRVIGDIRLEPRPERTPAWAEAMRARLAAEFPATIAR